MPFLARLTRLPGQLFGRNPFPGTLPAYRLPLLDTAFATLRHFRTPLRILDHVFRDGGDLKCLDVPGFPPILFVRDPEFIRAVTVETANQGAFERDTLPTQGIARVVGGRNLLYAQGDLWKKHRTAAAKPFGTGAVQSRFGLVISTGTDRFAQHVNVGYTFSGSTDVSTYIGDDPELQNVLLPSDTPPDEFQFNGGLEFAATDRLTLLGEFMGRTLRNVGRLEMGERSFSYTPQGLPVVSPALQSPTFREFQASEGSLTVGLAAIGAKYNVGSRALLSTHVLLPVTDGGLRSRVTMTFGLDYTF